jgi:type VI secretion system protein ImpE
VTDADALYREGRLDDAVEALGVALRGEPGDARRRTFLFELLCFAGDYSRAERQLDVLARRDREASAWALLFRGALHADRTRQELFASGPLRGPAAPDPATPPVSGTLNGRPFASLADADARVGRHLELFAAGRYVRLPLAQVASVRMAAPERLRDLLWAPAVVRPNATYRGEELGKVFLPVLAPLTWRHPSGAVRLGRMTEWEGDDVAPAPVGQKLLLVDGEEFPFLELRELDITAPDA